jgi:hypothetical protein
MMLAQHAQQPLTMHQQQWGHAAQTVPLTTAVYAPPTTRVPWVHAGGVGRTVLPSVQASAASSQWAHTPQVSHANVVVMSASRDTMGSRQPWEHGGSHVSRVVVPTTTATVTMQSSQWGHAHVARMSAAAIPPSSSQGAWGAQPLAPLPVEFLRRQAPGGDSPPNSAGYHVVQRGYDASGASPCADEADTGATTMRELEVELQRPRSAFAQQYVSRQQYAVNGARAYSPPTDAT